jgi:hypothetical protein
MRFKIERGSVIQHWEHTDTEQKFSRENFVFVLAPCESIRIEKKRQCTLQRIGSGSTHELAP